MGAGKGDFGFGGILKGEESGRLLEDRIDFFGADAVVDNAEETLVLGSRDKFMCDLINPRVEVGKRDRWNGSVEIFCLAHVGYLRSRVGLVDNQIDYLRSRSEILL